jgi:hypothetical protein
MGKKKNKGGRGQRQSGGGGGGSSSRRLHGLPNRGNTCYFNAVLQALAASPQLGERLRTASAPDGPLAEAFVRLVASLNDGVVRGTKPVPPDQLLGATRGRCPQFQGREQQDAQELYTMLLTGIEEEAAAAACNPDGTTATQAERRKAEQLLDVVSLLAIAAPFGASFLPAHCAISPTVCAAPGAEVEAVCVQLRHRWRCAALDLAGTHLWPGCRHAGSLPRPVVL